LVLKEAEHMRAQSHACPIKLHFLCHY